MRPRSRAATLTATILALGMVAAVRAYGDVVHVRVRASSRIEAQGVRDGGTMKLHGALVDDSGVPVARGALSIVVLRAGSAQALPLAGVTSCGSSSDARADSDGSALVTADDAGRFCARIPLPIDRYTVEVSFGGSAYVDATKTRTPVDLTRRACTLAFTPEPRVLSLDGRSTTFEASATLESDGQTAAGAGLKLTLSTERAPVATATTDGAGVARFTVASSQLGPPGQGELRLSFAGTADAAAAARVASVERHARVTLDVPGAPSGQLDPGAPEDGLSIEVHAAAAGGDVTGGSVEARVNDTVVGAAPVESGTARIAATFSLSDAEGASRDVPISLRYAPSAPWYEAGADTVVALPIRARSPLRQWPLLLVGLALAAWFATSRAAIQKRTRELLAAPMRERKRASPGEAKLDLVRRGGAGEGWRGRAVDADDGSPIANASVRIERPAFGSADVVASAVSDDEGRFELPPTVHRPGDELSIEAPLHVTLRRALPPPGELDAQLVLRKRALLGRLVNWAKARGRPFDARPEPTPGHVRRAAADDLRVARWAEAVERAAYAGGPIDERAEGDVDRLAPAAAAPKENPLDARALANPTKHNA